MGFAFLENPRRQGKTQAFWVDIFPVTNAEFEQFFPEHRQQRIPFSPYDDSPVVYVSWVEAVLYCLRTGKRLLTEAEWEKAGQGPLGLEYPLWRAL